MTYNVTKTATVTKIQAAAKQDVLKMLQEFFVEKFGDENVGMVRTGSGTSKVNELAVRFAVADDNGQEFPMSFTVNPVVKTWADRQAPKKFYPAFDFDVQRQVYEDYLIENEEKEAKAKQKKEEKIERDTKAREQKAQE